MTTLEIVGVLGDLGDFLGALAVFATIVYLSIQVRHSKQAVGANTRALEQQRKVVAAQSIRDVELALSEFNREVAASAELMRINKKLAKEPNPERWSHDEYLEIRSYLMAFVLLIQSEFRHGTIGIGDESSTRQYLRNFKSIVETVPGARLFWMRERDTFIDGFADAVDAIDDPPDLPFFFEGASTARSADSA